MRRTILATVGLFVAVGCDRAPEPPMGTTKSAATAKAANPGPSGDSFPLLLDAAVAELNAKNEANTAWGLGSFDRWDLDQEIGNLVFTKADGTKVAAKAQIIGSFSTNDNSWLWAWDNPSIVDGMKDHARQVRSYGERQKIEKLTTRKWVGTEADAWAMTALAVKLTNAQGAYRGPAGKSYVFMTFGEVQLARPADQN
jgi:hypothetical protein